MTNLSQSPYSTNYLDEFFFQIQDGQRVRVVPLQNEWGTNKLRFTATATSRTLSFYPGSNSTGPYEAVNISVTLNAVNSVPIAANDSRTVSGTTPITFNVLTNDSDPGGSLNVSSVDLDPSTAGIQNSFTNGQGTWSDRMNFLIYAYQNLMAAHSKMGRNDLAIQYAWKAKALYEEDAYTLSFLTSHHIEENVSDDSILHYLDRSTTFFNKNPTYVFERSIVYNQWGKYYEGKKNYNKAIESYKTAEKFAKESVAIDEVLKAYAGLSSMYE